MSLHQHISITIKITLDNPTIEPNNNKQKTNKNSGNENNVTKLDFKINKARIIYSSHLVIDLYLTLLFKIKHMHTYVTYTNM